MTTSTTTTHSKNGKVCSILLAVTFVSLAAACGPEGAYDERTESEGPGSAEGNVGCRVIRYDSQTCASSGHDSDTTSTCRNVRSAEECTAPDDYRGTFADCTGRTSYSTEIIEGGCEAREPHYLRPDELYHGKTLSEWVEDFMVWSGNVNPDNLHDCSAGQEGPVWFLPPWGEFGQDTLKCDVPAGKAILVAVQPVIASASDEGTACDESAFHEHGEKLLDAKVQDRLIAFNSNKHILDASILEAYRVVTKPFSWETRPESWLAGQLPLAGPNTCGIDPQKHRSVGVGRFVLFTRLGLPGEHTIRVVEVTGDPQTNFSTYADVTVH